MVSGCAWQGWLWPLSPAGEVTRGWDRTGGRLLRFKVNRKRGPGPGRRWKEGLDLRAPSRLCHKVPCGCPGELISFHRGDSLSASNCPVLCDSLRTFNSLIPGFTGKDNVQEEASPRSLCGLIRELEVQSERMEKRDSRLRILCFPAGRSPPTG